MSINKGTSACPGQQAPDAQSQPHRMNVPPELYRKHGLSPRSAPITHLQLQSRKVLVTRLTVPSRSKLRLRREDRLGGRTHWLSARPCSLLARNPSSTVQRHSSTGIDHLRRAASSSMSRSSAQLKAPARKHYGYTVFSELSTRLHGRHSAAQPRHVTTMVATRVRTACYAWLECPAMPSQQRDIIVDGCSSLPCTQRVVANTLYSTSCAHQLRRRR